MDTIYMNCPVFENEKVTLRLLHEDDTPELLNCYSDEQAVPLFNADNCHGDTFYYPTPERMKQAVDFWRYSYENKYFVRMTIIWKPANEIIGTVEMFNRGVAPYYGIHGVLRLDVMSRYEEEDVLSAVLQLAHEHFYREFGVEWIFTKAITAAEKRRKVLVELGYVPVEGFSFDHYYGRGKCEA